MTGTFGEAEKLCQQQDFDRKLVHSEREKDMAWMI
jgi:hypothetical protein